MTKTLLSILKFYRGVAWQSIQWLAVIIYLLFICNTMISNKQAIWRHYLPTQIFDTLTKSEGVGGGGGGGGSGFPQHFYGTSPLCHSISVPT